MGGVFSSTEGRDVTFHPDDIIVTPAVVERIQNIKEEKPPAEEPDTRDLALGRQLIYEQELEKKYDRRLRQVEERNEKLFKEAAEEYTRTVERLENKYIRPTPGGCCTAAEQRVEDCYITNPGRPLLCAKLASEYVRCVHNFRMVTSKGGLAAAT